MKLDRVTFTGADDTVNPEDLVKISQTFPFVEWGILTVGNRKGGTRFPSGKWIDRLLEVTNPSVNLCLHLCGRPVHNVLKYGMFTPEEKFQRSQLNFHGEELAGEPEFEDAAENIKFAQELWGGEFIFQFDGVNNHLAKEWVTAKLGVPLFDTSSGAGYLPQDLGEAWPDPIEGAYCGYAGGLGPDNVVEQVNGPICQAAGDARIWIDMETRVRSRGGEQFDLEKCKDVLEKLKGIVNG